MLYFDSSALIKRYVQEIGADAVDRRIAAETIARRPLLTSALTFAEIHRAFAARKRDGSLSESSFRTARDAFEQDWDSILSVIDLRTEVLRFIPFLAERFTLKSSDAVHVASALWIRNRSDLGPQYGQSIVDLTFATADRALAKVAEEQNLKVFNPQRPPLP